MKRLLMLLLLVCAGNVFGAASSSSSAVITLPDMVNAEMDELKSRYFELLSL